MSEWEDIQTELQHVDKFRDLNQRDWKRLCSEIKRNVMNGHDIKGQECRNEIIDRAENRLDEKRLGDRRLGNDRRQQDVFDFSSLRNISEHDWDKICDLACAEEVGHLLELPIECRRKGERRQEVRRKSDKH
jgi:hypothetical protein